MPDTDTSQARIAGYGTPAGNPERHPNEVAGGTVEAVAGNRAGAAVMWRATTQTRQKSSEPTVDPSH